MPGVEIYEILMIVGEASITINLSSTDTHNKSPCNLAKSLNYKPTEIRIEFK